VRNALDRITGFTPGAQPTGDDIYFEAQIL